MYIKICLKRLQKHLVVVLVTNSESWRLAVIMNHTNIHILKMSITSSVQVYFVQTIDTICITIRIIYRFSMSVIYMISVQCIHP